MCACVNYYNTFGILPTRWIKKRFCLQIAIFPNKFGSCCRLFWFLKKIWYHFSTCDCDLHELQQFSAWNIFILADFYRYFPHLEKREMKVGNEHRARACIRTRLIAWNVYFVSAFAHLLARACASRYNFMSVLVCVCVWSENCTGTDNTMGCVETSTPIW